MSQGKSPRTALSDDFEAGRRILREHCDDKRIDTFERLVRESETQ